jgi:hypothetical protein
MTKHLPAKDDDASLGPAMRDLCNERQRLFVENLFKEKSAAAAARAAGYGENSSALTVANIAHNLLSNPKVVAAINEQVKLRLRAEGAKAVRVVQEIMDDVASKDRLKAANLILERIDPVAQRVEVEHTHKIDTTAERLEQLRFLKSLNVAREKLLEVFGSNGLDHYEQLLIEQDKKSAVVDAEFTEIKQE